MIEAELLFSEVLNCSRLALYLDREKKLNKDASCFIASVLKKRIQGIPLPYILGRVEFMGLEFKVTPATFIPRPETEILVETTLKIVKLLNCQTVKLLDIGTGSGCIAVSLAKFINNSRIIAIDISRQALEVAQYNAKLNSVNDRVAFFQSDLFTDYRLPITDYDIIVSNPPYIATSDINNLHPELSYEPKIALDGARDGLDFYRRIILEAPFYLNEEGFLIMEIGFNQAEAIKNIFEVLGNFKFIEVVKDYSNFDRVIVAKYG